MSKKYYIFILCCSIFLTGCSISTPQGTVTLSYDKDKTSEETVFIDDNGNKTVIDTSSVKNYVDQLLNSVSLPDGMSTEDLNSFVYSNLESLGIDLNSLDFGNSEEIKNAENAIKNALEEQGIDTSDLDINLEQLNEDKINE